MGVHTHLPNADWLNDGWSLVGSGVSALYQALSNDDDTKYIKSPASKSGATVRFPVDISNVPDGAVITSVTVKLRAGTGTGSAPAGTPPSITVAVAADDNTARFVTRTIYPSSTATTFEIATYQRDALGLLWDIHRLNHILCRVFSYVGIFDLIRCYKFFCEVNYRVRPTVAVNGPTGTVTTPSPTVAWTYGQSDGDPQKSVEYKVFTAAAAAAPSFNPESAPPVYSTTLVGDVQSHVMPTSLNPNTYAVYVRVTSSFDAKSTWVSRQFTVTGPSPATPGVTDPTGSNPSGIIDVVPDIELGSATLRLRDTSNLLSVQMADFETSTDGLPVALTNATAARVTSVSFPGSTASYRLTSAASGTMSLTSDWVEVLGGEPITAQGQFLTAASGRACRVVVNFYDSTFGSIAGTLTGSDVTDATGTWTQATVTGSVPQTAAYAKVRFDVQATGGASEIHYVDHLGLAYGTNTPWSDGGHTSRNLLSSWYSSAEGTAGAGEAWTAASGTTTTTDVASGTGSSGSTCFKATYNGSTPSIALRAAGTAFNSATGGQDFTLNKPAGTTTGDLMLAFLTCSENTTLTPPSGWTMVNTATVNDGSTDTTMFVLKRTAGGSEPASWTDALLATSAARRTAVVVGYSGAADASLQFISEGQASTANDNPLFLTVPALQNTDPAAWRISAFAVSDNASGGTLVANKQEPSTVPAITFVGNSANWGQYSSSNSYQLNKPSGVVSGDVMVANLGVKGNVTVTAPSGWTIAHQGHNSSGVTHCVLYRVAGGSEPASWSATVSGSVDEVSTSQVLAYRNVNTTTPFINQNGQRKTSSTYIDTPTVNNSNSLAWRVELFASMNANDAQETWTANETAERYDIRFARFASWFYAGDQVSLSGYDSNGSVSSGNYTRRGTRSASFEAASAWIGILNPLASPPSPISNETTRATVAVGSSNPWMTTIVADSAGVVPAGPQAVSGVWTPGSGADMNSMAGWVGHIRPAAPVIAGWASATMATKVDVSTLPTAFTQQDKVSVTATFTGSVPGTPYLSVNFYRANVLLQTMTAEGTPFVSGVWAKSSAVFDVPEGTTRMNVGVAVADRAVSDIVYWDRVSLAFGSSSVFRPGTSRTEHPMWAEPRIQYADDDGTGYTDWRDLPGILANPPAFDPLSGMAVFADHTVVPLTNRKYRASTVSYGLAGDQFVSAWGPDSSEFSFEGESWWLKDISNPDSNIELNVKWDGFSVATTNTATVFQPLGEDKPVVLTEGYKGDAFSVTLIPVRHDGWAGLRKMLASGRTLFLQTDIDHAWWVRPVGDLNATVLATAQRQSNPLREIKVNFVEVAPEL